MPKYLARLQSLCRFLPERLNELSIVYSLILWMLQAALVLYLSFQFGAACGLTIFAVCNVFGSLLAGWLLCQSPVSQITWRNRVAGVLLPWTTVVGGGTVTHLMVKNAGASVVYGIVVVTCERMGLVKALLETSGESPSTQNSWWILILAWLTVTCWIIAGIGWLWVLKSCVVHRPARSSQLLWHRNHWIPLLLPPIVTVASILLWYTGQNLAAFFVVVVPLLVVLSPVILMVSVILGHKLMGKPIRWN